MIVAPVVAGIKADEQTEFAGFAVDGVVVRLGRRGRQQEELTQIEPSAAHVGDGRGKDAAGLPGANLYCVLRIIHAQTVDDGDAEDGGGDFFAGAQADKQVGVVDARVARGQPDDADVARAAADGGGEGKPAVAQLSLRVGRYELIRITADAAVRPRGVEDAVIADRDVHRLGQPADRRQRRAGSDRHQQRHGDRSQPVAGGQDEGVVVGAGVFKRVFHNQHAAVVIIIPFGAVRRRCQPIFLIFPSLVAVVIDGGGAAG